VREKSRRLRDKAGAAKEIKTSGGGEQWNKIEEIEERTRRGR
jgi:hypothetical protein